MNKEPEPKWRAALRACNGPPKPELESERPVGRFISWLTGQEREAESG